MDKSRCIIHNFIRTLYSLHSPYWIRHWISFLTSFLYSTTITHKPFKITRQEMSQFSKKSDLKGLTQCYISINFTLMHKIQVVICGKSLTLQSWDYGKKRPSTFYHIHGTSSSPSFSRKASDQIDVLKKTLTATLECARRDVRRENSLPALPIGNCIVW